jgi:hypothetical protein
MEDLFRRVATRYSMALRVAERFAAKRPMKPEKLQELMVKLRKGAGTSNKMEVLDQVFGTLGGWVWEDMLYLSPKAYNDENRSYYSNAHPGNVKATWDEAKAREVVHLPHNDQLSASDKYKSFYMNVGEIEPSKHNPGQTGFYYQEWRVSEGTRVRAPNGAFFETDKSLQGFLNEYPSNLWSFKKERFTDWLKKSTPFFDQINARLGLESYEEERAKARTPPRTRENTGTCPCCWGNFKLTPHTKHGKDKSLPGMILHGYKRPGTGYIHGNCFGQDWPPFELSPEGTIAWAKVVEGWKERAEEALKRLERREDTVLVFGMGRTYEKDKMTPHEWGRKYDERIADQKSTIKQMTQDLERLHHAISTWKQKPLPEATPTV